ncbi:MAG: creatininase family protein [Promethearchaeota archaeon]
MRYEEMTWTEIKDFILDPSSEPIILIPIGCLEEHGPHLPINTDGQLALDFARALIEIKKLKIMIGPVVDFGVSVLTQGFPGTLKIHFNTLKSLLSDIFRSCISWGFTEIIAWTWHGGSSHAIAIREACLEVLEDFPEINFFSIRAYNLFNKGLLKEKVERILESYSEHAGELETSLMQYLHPDAVRTGKLVKEYPRRPDFKIINKGYDLMTHGIIGDATRASLEKGKELFNVILDELSGIINEILNKREKNKIG